MKHWVFTATLALASVAAPATAASPSREVPLAAGEIPVRVVGNGEATSPADRATLVMNIKKSGSTVSEARANTRAYGEQLIAALVARGIPRTAITTQEGSSGLGFVGNEAFDAAAEAMAEARGVAASKTPTKSASMSIQVVLDDLSLLSKVRQFLDERDAVILQPPSFELHADGVARRSAINDAIVHARTEAESYAAATSMRVSRILSINDTAGEANPFGVDLDWMRKLMANGASGDAKIKTRVRVTVEFALTPR
jgi:uncharacterized protein YggE